MTEVTRCSRIEDSFKVIRSSLQHPLHRLIFNRALEVKDRVHLTALPKLCPTEYRRLGECSLLSCLRCLYESVHR
jgi:hypothetical protein